MAGEYFPGPHVAEIGEERVEPPRTFVELGVGQAMGYTRHRAFRPDDQYIGVENGYANERFPERDGTPVEGFKLIKSLAALVYPERPQMHFVVADGTQTPFKDETADEVLLANVFSDPLTAPLLPVETTNVTQARLLRFSPYSPPDMTKGPDRKYYYFGLDLGAQREALLHEAARITKVGGRIVINSYNTPEVVDHDEIVTWFQAHGFTAEVLTPDDPTWGEKTFGYNETADPGLRHRFLIATKDPPPADAEHE